MKLYSQPLTIAALALSLCVTAAQAQSVLLAGYDGYNTYEISGGAAGGTFQAEGDKYIRDPHQSAAAVTAGFTSELYMFSNVAKEPQWGGAGQTSLGYWGTGATAFSPAPDTTDGTNVYTVITTSTLEFRVTNGGTNDITLEKIHFAVKLDAGAGTNMTVAYASGALTASGGGSNVVNYSANANTGYDVDLTSILSDNILGAGESAVFTLVSEGGTNRMKVDDIGMSGIINSAPAGPVDAGTSTVVASPTSVLADDSATSTITVTLKDASGSAVYGEDVTLANTSGPGTPTISPFSTQTTNGSGVATFTVSSSTVGTEVFTATSSTDSTVMTQTASVEFTAVPVAGPVDAGNSTVVASPNTVPADGSALSTITVTLKDSAGLTISGEDVTLANTSGPGTPTIGPSSTQTTNGSGVATFTVSSSTAGTEVFAATSSTDSTVMTQTASVVFTEVGATFLVALLNDPIAATTSATENSAVENFYDGNEALDDLGTTNSRGNTFIASGVDSDGVAGTNAHIVVYDMGTTVSFDGFVHAQRKGDGFDDFASIDFWVTDTNPGDAATTVPLPIFTSQPTPDDSVGLERNTGVLTEYLLPGGTISGRYVVMRLNSAGGNPGGYTLQLGQTASVSDYDTWGSAYSGLGLPSEDDDLDGLSNEKEWLFGLNPQDASSASPFKVALDASDGTFSYTRRTQSLTGMTYKLLYSTNLVEWLWESGADELTGAPVLDVETVAVTIDPDLLDEPKLFLKLSAEDLGPPPVVTSLWGSNTSITMNFSEAMEESSSTNPAHYTVNQDGGGSISVLGAVLSGDGKSVTLTLGSVLAIGNSFTVTTNRIANGAGQPLGNGTSGQFWTWDNDPSGIKVFILAGQSNMVGYGHSEIGDSSVAGAIGSLRYLANNNGLYPEYDYTSLLVDPGQPATSNWKTRSDVKVWWKNGQSGNLDGPKGLGDLGPPFRGSNTNWFGPELGFGQVIGDYYATDDVLIIKAAWGGHKLVSDFRPPSAVADRGGEVGASYLEIFNDAREVLNNLDTEFPEWSGRGYQIVGFAWHQGTSDKAPVEVADEYKDNLPDLISDVRAEFGNPDLPFVIATTGMSNSGPIEPYPYTGYHAVEKAQLWVSGIDQPANVLTDDTRGYWEDAADSPANQGFHWNQNARSYFRVGLGLGNKMESLLSD